MEKIKIAIIDNGVDELALGKKISEKVYINEKKEWIVDDADMSEISFAHGTICAAIIQKHCLNSEIYSIRLLNEKGNGLIEHLKPALDWCIKKGIYLVNLSLGTTHFRDKTLLRTLINHYASMGIVIVAATSNSGYESYPASFSNIIGVAAQSPFFRDNLKNLFLGIDVLVESEHTITLCGVASVTQKSNSYAAPFVTAYIGRILIEQKFQDIVKIRHLLRKDSKELLVTLHEMYEPDWICNAVISADINKSRADFYFNVVAEGEVDQADTFIIDKLSDLDQVAQLGKHIIYIGWEKIKKELDNCFFWCPNDKVKFIDGCIENEHELDIPVIVCEVDNKMDEIFLLTELKKGFAECEYNIYTAGLKPENVLYELEYIPEQCLSKWNKVREFIYRQTLYKQNDGVLFSIIEEKSDNIKQLFKEIDVIVRIDKVNGKYLAKIHSEDIVMSKIGSDEMDKDFVEKIVNQLITILTEDEDG